MVKAGAEKRDPSKKRQFTACRTRIRMSTWRIRSRGRQAKGDAGRWPFISCSPSMSSTSEGVTPCHHSTRIISCITSLDTIIQNKNGRDVARVVRPSSNRINNELTSRLGFVHWNISAIPSKRSCWRGSCTWCWSFGAMDPVPHSGLIGPGVEADWHLSAATELIQHILSKQCLTHLLCGERSEPAKDCDSDEGTLCGQLQTSESSCQSSVQREGRQGPKVGAKGDRDEERQLVLDFDDPKLLCEIKPVRLVEIWQAKQHRSWFTSKWSHPVSRIPVGSALSA